MKDMNDFVRSYLGKWSEVRNKSTKEKQVWEEEEEEYEEEEEAEGHDDFGSDGESEGEEEEDDDAKGGVPTVASNYSTFEGVRIYDQPNKNNPNSYFKVNIEKKGVQYMHKQSACWLLSDKNGTLSSDRLKRVRQS